MSLNLSDITILKINIYIYIYIYIYTFLKTYLKVEKAVIKFGDIEVEKQ